MITKPPSRKKIEELINKGGSSPKSSQKKEKDTIVTTPLRIPKGMLDALDAKIKSPYGGKVSSRNAFIINCILKELTSS